MQHLKNELHKTENIFNKILNCDRKVLIPIIICLTMIVIVSIGVNKSKVKKATDLLYMATGVDTQEISYVYSPHDEFIIDRKIRKNYFIFKIKMGLTYNKSRVYVVDKKSFDIYVCDEKGNLILFRDYLNII